MLRRTRNTNITTPPLIATPKDQNVSAEDIKTPAATGAVEGKFKQLEVGLDRTNNFMYLVVVVLFVGFFTLGLMVATILIQAWTFSANTQLEFTKSVKQETQNIDQLNSTIDKLNITLQKRQF